MIATKSVTVLLAINRDDLDTFFANPLLRIATPGLRPQSGRKFYLTSAEMSDDNEVLKKKKQKKRKSQADIWSVILKEYELYCPSLAKVIELMFFKILKEMRSKKRNRLSAKKLRKLFLIYHFLDLEQYDRERVHELFLKHLQR